MTRLPRPSRGLAVVLAGTLLPGAAAFDGAGTGWVEAGADAELLPGDLGEGTEDLAAESYFAPRRTRRVPLSFSAIVLLLTLTSGIGMAAGLLAGPSPGITGHGAGGIGTGPQGPVPSPNGTVLPPSSTSLPHAGNTTKGSHGTNSPGNSTGSTGPGNSPGNSTPSGGNGTGNETRSHGSSTGNETGRGPGQNGTRGNTSSPGGRGNLTGNRTPPYTIVRGGLPWLPTDSRFYLLVGAALALAGLAVAVLVESFRPAPIEGDPWRGDNPARRRARPRRRRPLTAYEALDLAVRRLREELFAYHRSAGAGADREVRERIIRLYAALLSALGPGLGDLAGRTPREVEWLSVRYLGVRPTTAHDLTWLFEEARYSSHPLPPASVVRAERALDEFVADLEAQRRAAP